MKIAYSRPNIEGVCIVSAAPKAGIERVLGKLTDEAYEAHVMKRSIPADAVEVVRLPGDWEPPTGRELRGTWRLMGGRVVSVPERY